MPSLMQCFSVGTEHKTIVPDYLQIPTLKERRLNNGQVSYDLGTEL